MARDLVIHSQEGGLAHLARLRVAAAPAENVELLTDPRFVDEVRESVGLDPEHADPGAGAVRGREEPDPGAGPHLADALRHHDAVCSCIAKGKVIGELHRAIALASSSVPRKIDATVPANLNAVVLDATGLHRLESGVIHRVGSKCFHFTGLG